MLTGSLCIWSQFNKVHPYLTREVSTYLILLKIKANCVLHSWAEQGGVIESALKKTYVVSSILTFGIQLKALSLIYGISFFTFKFQLHKTRIVILRTCQNVTAYFFHLNVNLLISASPVLLQYRHLARFCAFSHVRKLKVNCLK